MYDTLESLVNDLDVDKKIINLKSDVDKKELSSDNSSYTLSLRRTEFTDEKEFAKFIKACEGEVRYSPEYKIWGTYVREVLGHISCVLTGKLHSQTTVELHHYPFSLYSITKAIINQYIASGKEFCSYDVATKIIELHYEDRIGFLPLVSSLHDKFHNGFLLIPIELVYGDYKYFLQNYVCFLEDADIEIINTRLGINKDNCGWTGEYGWVRDNYPTGKDNLNQTVEDKVQECNQ